MTAYRNLQSTYLGQDDTFRGRTLVLEIHESVYIYSKFLVKVWLRAAAQLSNIHVTLI